MSFVFSWDKLDDDVALQLQEMIHNHFQRIPKPNFIGSLTVTNFRLGSTPPSITVLDITDPLEEWYLDMDREEARLAKEAAEAGGGESMDEEEMASDDYEDDDDDDDYDDGDRSPRGRRFGYGYQGRRSEAGGRRSRRRKYSLTDEEGLVMVGEGEVIEYLDSDDYDHEQDQLYDDDDESPERPWKPKRASASKTAGLGAKPYRVSRSGQGFVGGADSLDEDPMRADMFRSAIASPTAASPDISSDSSIGISGATAERTSTNTTNTTAALDTMASQLSISPHSSDEDIESQALYTQGESTIYQQLRKLHISSTPTVLEGMKSPSDLDSPDGGLPFNIEAMASTTTVTEDESLSVSASRMVYSPLLSPSGSTPSLGSIGGAVGMGAFQSRTSRTFSMSSATTATASAIGTDPPISLLPAALLNHHDYHQGFGSGNSLLGLGRKQLGVGTVYSPRSGGTTPVGFESPIAGLSRRPSVSDTNKDTAVTSNSRGSQEESHSKRMFSTPRDSHPTVFNPVSHQNLSVHQQQQQQEQRPPSTKPGTRSTPASVFSSKDSSSTSGLLDLPSASGESSTTTTKSARRRTGTGLWSAISPSLSGLGKALSSGANSVASNDSRQSGSQQDGKEKPSLVLRADQLLGEEDEKANRRTRAQHDQQHQQRQASSRSSARSTLSTASNEYIPKIPRNPQKPRSSQKSSSSVNGWDGDRSNSPHRRFGDGYSLEDRGEGDDRPRRVATTSSRQSTDTRHHDHQQRQRRRRRRRQAHSPSPAPSPILPGSSKRHENDLQLMLNVHYQGQMGFTIETELLLNYPTFAFLALPIKLTITSFSFKAKVLMAYLRDHVNVCFLEPDDPNDHILSNVRFQSQVGDEQKQAVLKNVTKVEHFVVDQLRKFITEDFVYPSYHSIKLTRPDPQPQQQQQQQQQQQHQPNSESSLH
ncbi:Mitochondrial distribution and morphology protein 12 [Actinomortierella ambigua]|nr:Mitochondrial distribution and morphology protein 12 [Actinomortierella ambigua]